MKAKHHKTSHKKTLKAPKRRPVRYVRPKSKAEPERRDVIRKELDDYLTQRYSFEKSESAFKRFFSLLMRRKRAEKRKRPKYVEVEDNGIIEEEVEEEVPETAEEDGSEEVEEPKRQFSWFGHLKSIFSRKKEGYIMEDAEEYVEEDDEDEETDDIASKHKMNYEKILDRHKKKDDKDGEIEDLIEEAEEDEKEAPEEDDYEEIEEEPEEEKPKKSKLIDSLSSWISSRKDKDGKGLKAPVKNPEFSKNMDDIEKLDKELEDL